MAGNNSIRGDETVTFTDNMSFDGTERGGKMTTDGQLWIGATALPHVRLGSLTAGTGVSITNGSGTITIGLSGAVVGQTITGNTGGALSPVLGNWNILGSATPSGTNPVSSAGSGNTLVLNVQRSQAVASTDLTRVGLAAFNSAQFSVDANGFVALNAGGFTWNNVTAASATMVKENGYQANNAGLVTLTMPSVASSTFGDTIKVAGFGAGGWLIQCVATQIIHVGSAATAAAGSVASTNRYDGIEIVCSSTTTEWFVNPSFVGNLTVV